MLLIIIIIIVIVVVVIIIIIIINSISAYQRQNYPFNKKLSLKLLYYISKLVRALWLVNLAGRSLLHGPLKLKVLFAVKLLRDLSPNFLNLWSD